MKRTSITFRVPVQLVSKVKLASKFLGLTMTSYFILALSERLTKDISAMYEERDKWKQN